MTAAPQTYLDFYFDFLSPYAYLASSRIETIAERHGRTVRWHSFRLGVAVVKVMGLKPLMETPLKNSYIIGDLNRLAKVMDLPLIAIKTLPDPIPPALAFHAAPQALRGPIARTLLNAQWAQGRDIGDVDVLRDLLSAYELPHDFVAQALTAPSARDALRATTTTAIDTGVFGSPTVVADGDLFWGTDRLWLLDQFLADGGYSPTALR